MKKIALIALSVMAVLLSACVKDQLYPYAAISGVKNTDAIGENPVVVTADVSAFVDVEKVELVYTAGSAAAQTVAMTASGTTYSGTIPAQPLGTEVKYHVEATTSSGTVSSAEGKYTVAAKPAEPKTLFINEVNCGTKQFEIYNASSKDVNIAGYTFTKDDKDPWTVPEGKGTIAAKGYLVFTAKNADINEGPAFGLSGTKGFKLTMLDKEGVLADEIDNSATVDGFKVVNDGTSLGRKTDGADEWVIFSTPSIGETNANGVVAE